MKPSLSLVQASLVFVIPHNAPAFFTPEFMLFKGIVPREIKKEERLFKEVLITPAITRFRFARKLLFQATEQRVEFHVIRVKDVTADFQLLQQVGEKFAGEVFFRVTALGINFLIEPKPTDTKLLATMVSCLPNNTEPRRMDFSISYTEDTLHVSTFSLLADPDTGAHRININNHFELASISPEERREVIHSAIHSIPALHHKNTEILHDIYRCTGA